MVYHKHDLAAAPGALPSRSSYQAKDSLLLPPPRAPVCYISTPASSSDSCSAYGCLAARRVSCVACWASWLDDGACGVLSAVGRVVVPPSPLPGPTSLPMVSLAPPSRKP